MNTVPKGRVGEAGVGKSIEEVSGYVCFACKTNWFEPNQIKIS